MYYICIAMLLCSPFYNVISLVQRGSKKAASSCKRAVSRIANFAWDIGTKKLYQQTYFCFAEDAINFQFHRFGLFKTATKMAEIILNIIKHN